jgi:electron-transferring-flavoprotein dehydrogenase
MGRDMQRVDVAVVGGGPAGTSAAAAAAGAGADTVLFEKGVPRADREGLGPDSTDAAGFLDYWLDIAGFDFEELPDDVVMRELDRAEFVGPSEAVSMESTGISSSYDRFGFTFHRARFDDWLHERAADAGADLRVGTSVTDVDSDLGTGHHHTLTTADGDEVRAEYLVLADGPQRQVTMRVLDRLLPENRAASDVLNPTSANHIAYQEYREFPEDAFDPDSIKFWWGWMPGETAYPWVFPNDGRVARVGLTMPIGLDLDELDAREEYRLLRPEDERVPQGGTYIRRLLEELYGDEYDVESDFPLVEDRGKDGGTETYPISSTRPIDSPTRAGIAVAGGAMGTTSAFHEGGDHVAVRTGKLAGRLAAEGNLGRYNDAWKAAIGDELVRNVAFADIVEDYRPGDWDRVFRTARQMLATGESTSPSNVLTWARATGVTGLKLAGEYAYRKFSLRDGRYVQLRESEYRL